MGVHFKCATIDHPASYLHILFSTCYYHICSRSERKFRGTERDQSVFVSLTPVVGSSAAERHDRWLSGSAELTRLFPTPLASNLLTLSGPGIMVVGIDA